MDTKPVDETDPFGESGTRHSAPGDCPTWYDWCRCTTPRPEVSPDFDPLTGPVTLGDRWDGTAGGPEDPDETPSGDGWKDGRIVDMRGMESAGRRVMEAEEQVAANDLAWIAELEALNRKIEAATRRKEAANAPFAVRAARYRQHMEVFARLNPGDVLKGLSAKAKSRLLACGLRVKYGTEGGYFRVDQKMKPAEAKAALVKWALELSHIPDLIREEPVANVDAVKGYLATLECIEQRRPVPPPGMEWVEESQSLSIVVEEKKR